MKLSDILRQMKNGERNVEGVSLGDLSRAFIYVLRLRGDYDMAIAIAEIKEAC